MIYFIQQGHFGPIKIGYSSNPASRFSALKTATHAHLRFLGEIEGTDRDERRLHEQFSAHRIRREWFAPTQDLIDYIRKVTNTNPFIDWFDDDAMKREAKDRGEGWPGVTGARNPKPLTDMEIIPPSPSQRGWLVRSQSAGLNIYDDTLEDALTALINDNEFGVTFGWDALRFPEEPKDE